MLEQMFKYKNVHLDSDNGGMGDYERFYAEMFGCTDP